MVGMFVSLCLASQKPSEREFFVPAGTDLGVKLLPKNTRYGASLGGSKSPKGKILRVFSMSDFINN